MERRDFLTHGSVTAAALASGTVSALAVACAPPPSATPAARTAAPGRADVGATGAAWRGTVLRADEGDLMISGRRRAPMLLKVDSAVAHGATMSMLVSEVASGAAIPVHLHQREDEIIFLHTGQGIVTLGDQRVPCAAGSMLYAPKGVWHGVENTGTDVLTWCAIWSPPGFEQFFKEVGVRPGEEGRMPSPEEATAIGRKYGMLFRDG
jgi:mannose-6-phosphate isomerase-like protein (cupin superfamily)